MSTAKEILRFKYVTPHGDEWWLAVHEDASAVLSGSDLDWERKKFNIRRDAHHAVQFDEALGSYVFQNINIGPDEALWLKFSLCVVRLLLLEREKQMELGADA